MKIKVNIELIDDKHDLAWYENSWITKEHLIYLYKQAFAKFLDEAADGIRYTLDVGVED